MRFSPRRTGALVVLALAASTLPALSGSPALAREGADQVTGPSYTKQTLHFKVGTGTGRKTVCDIVGDLYLPKAASRRHRVPAILTTNGFGGSKDDQAGLGRAFAARGYAVLSYSGLGFGGSGCKITLDAPATDGVAGSQLISFLGGAPGIAYRDAAHTKPFPVLRVVKHDAKAHNGRSLVNDPRVGMVGGSYGGQIQFAIASVDPRLDTIIPIITWSDLSYSLGPNNTGQTTGVSTRVPGATKLTWGLGFSLLGIVNGVINAQTDPMRLIPCPNYASFVCPALVTAGTLGYFVPTSTKNLRRASVASYIKKIRIPTLIIQGQNDTLFNINEGVSNYRALQAQGTETKMIWQWWGHSDGNPAPGEIDLAHPDPKRQYETGRIAAWLDRYLKDRKVDTGPEFAFFRNWVRYRGNAKPAYGTSARYPVGSPLRYHLSGRGLRARATGLVRGTQTFLTAPAGAPTSLNALDAISYFAKITVPEADLPGTTAHWDSAALSRKVDVVGSPRLTLKVQSPTAATTQVLGPAGKLVLFIRIQDVGPNGKVTEIRNLTAPVRVPDVAKPFTVTMPGFVHRFAPGHRIRLTIAAGSLNYRGGLGANPVTIRSGSAGQVLELPVVR